jgi:polyisoprenyl-teichoic acid--peptidoglycan teichoic acid transferase
MANRIGFLSTMVFLSVLLGFLVFSGFVGVKSVLDHKSITSEVGTLFVDPPQKFFAKDRINVLLLGIDYNYDAKDQEYSVGARSDTIMALSLVFPTAENPKPVLHILSVPRDMLYTDADGHQDKINAAYQLGGADPIRSAHASERAVAGFLDLPGGFDRFVTLRINATKELIDAIGGIDVVPDETMNYDDSWGHLHIHFKGGRLYHMNGDQAVSYSRFRHDACSDPCRIKRQQQVIHIAINTLKNEKFNDFLHMRQLIDVVNRNVMTDFNTSEELSIASVFAGLDLASLKADQVPYVSDETLPCCGNVVVADDDVKTKLVKTLFLDPIVPQVDPNVVAAIAPSSIVVYVENGSGEMGMGAKMALLLRAKGFKVAGVTNADSFDYDTTEIHVHSRKQPLAGERVRSSLHIAGGAVSVRAPEPDGKMESDVTVIVGRDHISSLK